MEIASGWVKGQSRFMQDLWVQSSFKGRQNYHPLKTKLYSHVCQSCWYKRPGFLGVLHPLCSYMFSASVSTGLPEFPGEGYDGDILFTAECYMGSVSFWHDAWLWISAFISICWMKKHLWWGPSKVPLIFVFLIVKKKMFS